MIRWASFDSLRDAVETSTGITVYEYRTGKGTVKTPYIILGEVTGARFCADDGTYVNGSYVDLILLSYQPQAANNSQKLTAESKIEAFLNANKIPFSKDSVWLNEVQLFQTSYSLKVWYE